MQAPTDLAGVLETRGTIGSYYNHYDASIENDNYMNGYQNANAPNSIATVNNSTIPHNSYSITSLDSTISSNVSIVSHSNVDPNLTTYVGEPNIDTNANKYYGLNLSCEEGARTIQGTESDLDSILKKTARGQHTLTKTYLDPKERQFIVKAVAAEILGPKPNSDPIPASTYKKWAQLISSKWTNENPESYYMLGLYGLQCKADGILFRAVANLRTQYITNKVYVQRRKSGSSTTSLKSQEYQRHVPDTLDSNLDDTIDGNQYGEAILFLK